MDPIAIIELTLAFCLGSLLLEQVAGKITAKSVRQLKLYLALGIFYLFIDAVSYIVRTPPLPFFLFYTIDLLSYTLGSVLIILFIRYRAEYIREKTELNPWLYRVPELIMWLCTALIVAAYLTGRITRYENGVVAEDNGLPTGISVLMILVTLYLPFVAFSKRKRIGTKAAILFGLFDLLPIIAFLTEILTEQDYTVIFVAVETMLVVSLVQAERTQEYRADRLEHAMLAENYSRFFALEDSFEALYDVELDSGLYTSFVKGDFYQTNVIDRLASTGYFFEDLRENIDGVICDEDRDGLYRTLTRDSLQRELAENEHFDYYYRLSTETGPVWFKLRVVYKDDKHRNVIIGAFNAEGDVQAKQLQEALTAAENANRAKSEFLFNMSHDIRTPMNAILGFTAMARKHPEDPAKVEDCLTKVQQSGTLLLSLINSVLDMSVIEAGSAAAEESPGDILLSFSDIEAPMRELAAAGDLSISFEFGRIDDRYVFADLPRCIRILTNLITNAIKYSHAGGFVRVRCEQLAVTADDRALYRYTVEDNGIGMSEDFLRRMFEPFSREHNTTQSGIQGTGLGLSVVRTFVDYLGGTIKCESSLGKGTRFTVDLPFRLQKGSACIDPVTGDLASGDARPEEEGAADFRGKRVLLVEDNEFNREIASDLLAEEGLSVEEAEDGSVAVELLREKGPDFYDFVLMDIQMPVMNGYQAAETIRAMYPEAKLPIIALSANAFEEDRRASAAAGMDAHVVKPINTKELFGVLSRFVR